MQFPTVKVMNRGNVDYQVMISDGKQNYRIYRGLAPEGPSMVYVTRRAPSGERRVLPTFYATDRSTLLPILLANEIKTLLGFLPDTASVTTVRYMLFALAEHYHCKIEGHRSKPYCCVDRKHMIDRALFSNDALDKLREVAKLFGIYTEKGK